MRASVPEQKGAIGVHEVAAKFERIGWSIAKNTDHNLGTNPYLAPRDECLFDLATIAGAQVKAGDRMYFREVARSDDGDVTGWWYREPKRDHFDYWVDHRAPHFLVLGADYARERSVPEQGRADLRAGRPDHRH